jgi:hypothetical protein
MIKALRGNLLDRRTYEHGPYRPLKVNAEISVLVFDIADFSKTMTNLSMAKLVEAMHTAIDDLLTPDYYWNEDGDHGADNNFVLIPTGDGYAVAFNTSFANQNVLEITRSIYLSLKGTGLNFRMGLAKANSVLTLDLNGNVNIFGVGIVLATRVCNAAKTGQILVHEDFAESLLQLSNVKELRKVAARQAKHGLELLCYNFSGTYNRRPFGLPLRRDRIGGV